ncbi:MAG: DUF202 domain-containing protein [Nanoarchaeota archaeon]|nr:DUF202 domain-containing protein [Nanoarchaeota archaeon]
MNQEKRNANLAQERTYLAYERTMLAYFRTAFAALLFGFALVKLSQETSIIYIGSISMGIGIVFFIIGLYYSPFRKKVRAHHILKN